MTTRYLQLAHHHATGVTLTDTTLRFVVLTQHSGSVLPERYGEVIIPEGCLSNGAIVDKARFVSFLKKTRNAYKLDSINLVLDSAQIQTFSVSSKGAVPLYIREAVEKEFGLPAKDIVYEYKAIGGTEEMTTMQVTAIAKSASQDFLNAFKSAGITVLSIESVGHALSRALLPLSAPHNILLIHIDTAVTSLTFIVHNRIAQTIHLAFGDSFFTKAVMDAADVTADKAQGMKQEEGLLGGSSKVVFDAIADDCVAFVRHINDAYVSWRKAHPALPPLHTIYLTGVGSLLRGLDEYISVGLRVPVEQGNVWANCFSFDDHIPAMPQSEAVLYGPAIGVALVGPHMINLLPYNHQKSIRRKRAARMSGKVILSFILGVAVGFVVARAVAIPGVHTKMMDVLHKIEARWYSTRAPLSL